MIILVFVLINIYLIIKCARNFILSYLLSQLLKKKLGNHWFKARNEKKIINANNYLVYVKKERK